MFLRMHRTSITYLYATLDYEECQFSKRREKTGACKDCMLSWQVALPLAFFAPAIATFVMGRGVARSTLALQIRLLMCPPFGERNLLCHLEETRVCILLHALICLTIKQRNY